MSLTVISVKGSLPADDLHMIQPPAGKVWILNLLVGEHLANNNVDFGLGGTGGIPSVRATGPTLTTIAVKIVCSNSKPYYIKTENNAVYFSYNGFEVTE
ncbi:MAG TPA: hypothetical protein ENI23_08160 [bacterium]|nr:hypothetical protein [bacterium]